MVDRKDANDRLNYVKERIEAMRRRRVRRDFHDKIQRRRLQKILDRILDHTEDQDLIGSVEILQSKISGDYTPTMDDFIDMIQSLADVLAPEPTPKSNGDYRSLMCDP